MCYISVCKKNKSQNLIKSNFKSSWWLFLFYHYFSTKLKDNFNTPSIFDESDTRVITWDSGNKTFLRKEGIIAGTGITIQDVSDTIPKLKLNVDSNIDSLWEVDKDNLNFVKLKDNKGIIANSKRIIDVGTPTFETDGTNKEYVDNLIEQKQDKLIAGENIKIDEKTNTISANGESLWEIDPNSSNIIQPKEKRLITANNKRIVNIGEPEQDKDATTKKYVDDKVNTKQDKEIWKVISKSKNNREWDTFEINFNTVYRVIITLDELPVNQANIKHKVEFKTGNYLGGDYLLAKFKIKDEDVILTLTVRESSFNCSLYLKGGDINYGAILSLEELQNTIKVDVTPKIKINSKSLETNEVEENCWDIELPNNPTPSPNNQQWKDVGTREKNKWDNWQITYDFIVNKHYRVYYSWSIYNPVYTIQEFIITDNKIAGVPIQTFNDSVNIVILSVQHAKLITIYSGKGNLKGNIWKLEEL
ncbi:hypothetical protein [Spiroplasma endosymbiont of Amphimallon solstitiale]|uniref:hypothetical protein n=1 Tax=Spiroplasma endosymbiont of Amphimallon solstitiale TaxID=3066288 RepID=UPI00313EE089